MLLLIPKSPVFDGRFRFGRETVAALARYIDRLAEFVVPTPARPKKLKFPPHATRCRQLASSSSSAGPRLTAQPSLLNNSCNL